MYSEYCLEQYICGKLECRGIVRKSTYIFLSPSLCTVNSDCRFPQDCLEFLSISGTALNSKVYISKPERYHK